MSLDYCLEIIIEILNSNRILQHFFEISHLFKKKNLV